MRLVCLLGAVTLCLAGCSSEPTRRGRTLVGRWEVTGENVPLIQTFTKEGLFTSESRNELPLENGEKVEAVIVVGGSYKYDGRKLFTTIGSIDVRGVSQELKDNLVHNSQENIGKSHSAVLEWKSDEKIVAKQPDGNLLMYNLIK